MSRSNNTITKKTTTLFLSFVLIAGTITTFFPSYIIDTAQAIPDSIIDNYKSKYIPYNKDVVKYNNFNLNLEVEEGLNLVNIILESLDTLVQTEIREGKNIGSSTSTYGNSEKYGYIDDKNDFTFAYSNNKDNEQLTPTPTTTTDENNVYVVWEDDTSGNNDILFAGSPNNGQTFSAAENLSDNMGESDGPRISSSTL